MRLLNAKEVSGMLGVSLARVYELTRQGILPSIRIGTRQIRFEHSRLLQWIQYGGRLDDISLDAESAEDGSGTIGEKSSASQSKINSSLHEESDEGFTLRFGKLRKFEPVRFVLECTLRAH
jgi:excisionase family DNA binding protein